MRARTLLLAVAGALSSACVAKERIRPPAAAEFQLYAELPGEPSVSQERVALGRSLFFDPALSADGTISCASCHLPEFAFSDTVAVSRGVRGQLGTRNAPTLVNVANQRFFFWDGRVRSLEVQVLEPIQNPIEMDRTLDDVVAYLRGAPQISAAFQRAYGGEASSDNLASALASYLRTLRAGTNGVERARSGEVLLSGEATRGAALFRERGRCAICHLGPHLKDDDFHNTGVAARSGDPGRFAVTGIESDRGAFRTPTLRNIALTAPYMHDGSLATLEDVVDFYDGGGIANDNLDPLVRPLNLTAQEKRDLVAFLRALTDGAAPPPREPGL